MSLKPQGLEQPNHLLEQTPEVDEMQARLHDGTTRGSKGWSVPRPPISKPLARN